MKAKTVGDEFVKDMDGGKSVRSVHLALFNGIVVDVQVMVSDDCSPVITKQGMGVLGRIGMPILTFLIAYRDGETIFEYEDDALSQDVIKRVWHNPMPKLALITARKGCGFSISEAAKYVGKVNESTWRKWESGSHPDKLPPDDVCSRFAFFGDWISCYSRFLKTLMLTDDSRGSIACIMPWYESAEDFAIEDEDELPITSHPIECWRPYCTTLIQYRNLFDFVQFDKMAFLEWCNDWGHSDSIEARHKWAVYAYLQGKSVF